MQLSFECVPRRFRSYKRPALIVGHPGHELRVLGWLAENRPRVHVLTDGSGGEGCSRLPETSALLNKLGARPGEVFGILSDAAIYRAILAQEIALFCAIADELARSLVEHGTDFVAADAAEGFSPTHDICRQLANAAVYQAQMRTGRLIANYDFCLTEWDLNSVVNHDHRCWHLRLEDRLLQLKLDAARGYGGLETEVEQAIALKGEEYFRIECLRKASQPFLEPRRECKPYYERVGQERVSAGTYHSAILYESHVLPILTGIRDHVLRPPGTEVQSSLEVKDMKALP